MAGFTEKLSDEHPVGVGSKTILGHLARTEHENGKGKLARLLPALNCIPVGELASENRALPRRILSA